MGYMATVLASDGFDRANANPIGGSWTTASSESAMQIVSNVCTPSSTAADCGAYYSGRSFPADQFSRAKLTVSGTAGSQAGAVLKVRQASAARTCYQLEADHAATLNVDISRVVTGTFTSLTGFPVTQAWTDGDTWELRITGQTLQVFLNGIQVGANALDSVITSGSPGIGYSSVETSASINDWEGGIIGCPLPANSMTPTQRMA